MKKRLSEQQFDTAVSTIDVGEQTIAIARGVLVLGQPQAHFVATLGLSKGAVSQAVNRVWSAADRDLPDGFEHVEAILPSAQANKVRRWDADAKEAIKRLRTPSAGGG